MTEKWNQLREQYLSLVKRAGKISGSGWGYRMDDDTAERTLQQISKPLGFTEAQAGQLENALSEYSLKLDVKEARLASQ